MHKLSGKLAANRFTASPAAAICGECVEVCVEVIEERKRADPPQP